MTSASIFFISNLIYLSEDRFMREKLFWDGMSIEDRIRNIHKLIVRDFEYGYDEEEDLMWVTINNSKVKIPCRQTFKAPLKDEGY